MKENQLAVGGASDPDRQSRDFIEDMLNYFYPVHYRLGMEMESAMGQGRISRKHAALLWLVHSRLSQSQWVTRKEIETALSGWFEISNSKISRMLRELAGEPLGFLEVAETPDSAREKMVRLTGAGVAFVDGMVSAAVDSLQARLGHLTPEQLRWGLDFFRFAFQPETGGPPPSQAGMP